MSLTDDYDDDDSLTFEQIAQRGGSRADRIAEQVALCTALGIDPNTTRNVRVTWDGGGRGAVASWEGARRLTATELSNIVHAVEQAGSERPVPPFGRRAKP